jgi:hypothetical protein
MLSHTADVERTKSPLLVLPSGMMTDVRVIEGVGRLLLPSSGSMGPDAMGPVPSGLHPNIKRYFGPTMTVEEKPTPGPFCVTLKPTPGPF